MVLPSPPSTNGASRIAVACDITTASWFTANPVAPARIVLAGETRILAMGQN